MVGSAASHACSYPTLSHMPIPRPTPLNTYTHRSTPQHRPLTPRAAWWGPPPCHPCALSPRGWPPAAGRSHAGSHASWCKLSLETRGGWWSGPSSSRPPACPALAPRACSFDRCMRVESGRVMGLRGLWAWGTPLFQLYAISIGSWLSTAAADRDRPSGMDTHAPTRQQQSERPADRPKPQRR